MGHIHTHTRKNTHRHVSTHKHTRIDAFTRTTDGTQLRRIVERKMILDLLFDAGERFFR